MANINFPNNPVQDDIFTVGGKTYTYDGVKWVANTNATKNDIGLGLVANRGPADVNVIQDQVDGTDNDTTVMSPYLTDEYVNRRIADQAEAEAGSDDFKLMTPQRTAQAITDFHPDQNQVSDVDNSANDNYIKSLTFDDYGHVTGVTSGEVVGGITEINKNQSLNIWLGTKNEYDNYLSNQNSGLPLNTLFYIDESGSIADVNEDNFSYIYGPGLEDDFLDVIWVKEVESFFIVGRGYRHVLKYTTNNDNISSIETTSLTQSLELTQFAGGSYRGITFADGGTKMFVNDANEDKMLKFTLTTPYDLSTVSYQGLSQSLIDSIPAKTRFNNDGTKAFVVEFNAAQNYVVEYTMSTPYDVNNMQFSFGFNPDDTLFTFGFFNAAGLWLTSDGKKLYVSGSAQVAEYKMSIPFDLSTAVNTGVSGFVQPSEVPGSDSVSTVTFNDSMTKMYVGYYGGAITQWDVDLSSEITPTIKMAKLS